MAQVPSSSSSISATPERAPGRPAPDPRPHRRPRKRDDWINCALIAIFVLAFTLPLLEMVLHFDRTDFGTENRELANWPQLPRSANRAAWHSFLQGIKPYFEDHFGFRRRLIEWHGRIMVDGLGVSSSSQVVLGKEGWLFFTGDRSIEDYRHARLFTPLDLQEWGANLEAQRRWFEGRGIRFMVLIPPNAYTIYPQYMPPAYNRLGEVSRLDQLIEYLRGHTQVTIIDMRPALLAAKASEVWLYRKADTHWNPVGAFYGYLPVARKLSEWFPQIHPLDRQDFDMRAATAPVADLARMLGLGRVHHEEWVELTPRPPARWHAALPADRTEQHIVTERPDAPDLPRAVMFRDSFAVSLMPYLSENFRRIVYLRQDKIDPRIIEQEHPDVVIFETVERHLTYPLPAPPAEIMALSGLH